MPRFKTLGDRCKAYESVFKQKLTPRMVTIIRLDGKSFGTYTKGLARPFTKSLFENMEKTTEYLVRNVQGCKLGYYQSDEITLVLTDFDDYDTQSWFEGQVQKICSISASMATSYMTMLENLQHPWVMMSDDEIMRSFKRPMFDARVFQVPSVTEAVNVVLWRQQDATRNSIQACARSLYSDKECTKKNQGQMQEMIFQKSLEFKDKIRACGWGNDIVLNKENFNWNDLPDKTKRGVTVYKSSNSTYVHEAINYADEQDRLFVRNLFPLLDDFYEEKFAD